MISHLLFWVLIQGQVQNLGLKRSKFSLWDCNTRMCVLHHLHLVMCTFNNDNKANGGFLMVLKFLKPLCPFGGNRITPCKCSWPRLNHCLFSLIEFFKSCWDVIYGFRDQYYTVIHGPLS